MVSWLFSAPARDALRPFSDRLTATVAERFLVPAITSPRAALWIAGYRALSVPFVTVGTARRYRASLEGEDFPVLCVGRQRRFRALITRLLAGQAQLEETSIGCPLWNPDRFSPTNPGLVAVELHPSLARQFQAAGWLICPESVRWRGSLSQMPPAKRSSSLQSDLKRVRRGRYTLEEAAGSKLDWDEFKRGMVIPYARRRFGEEVWIPSSLLLRDLEARGKLLFVIKEGRRVAGVCVLCNRDQAWIPLLGVKDGDLALMREGALAGLYALTIDWARGIGIRGIDFGRTSAFQLDGLAQFKRKWGMSPVRDPLSHLIAIRVDPAQPALQRALEREPFLIESEDGLQVFPR